MRGLGLFYIFQAFILSQSLEFQNCQEKSIPGQPLWFNCQTDEPIEKCTITQKEYGNGHPIFECMADLEEGEHWCYFRNLRVIITPNSCEVIRYYMNIYDQGEWYLVAEGVDSNGLIQVCTF